MTPEEINVAIAEACGWKWCIVRDEPETHRWQLQTAHSQSGETSPGSPWSVKFEVADKPYGPEKLDIKLVPNYHEDLNACREAIMALPVEGKESQKAMRFWLWEVAGKMTAMPSAPQACEAYLRMKGLWKE